MTITQADIELLFNRFRKARFFSQKSPYRLQQRQIPSGPRTAVATRAAPSSEEFHACVFLRAEDDFEFVGSFVDDDRPKEECMSDDVVILVPDRASAEGLAKALRWAADRLEAELG